MIHASWAPAASSAADRVGERLTGGVVDVDLEHDHGLAAEHRFARRADHHLRDVGLIVEIAAAGAEAAPVDGHRQAAARSRTPVRRASAAPVGVVSSTPRSSPRVGAPRRQQLHDGRGRVREQAVRGADHARAGDHDRRVDRVDLQHLEGGAGADHVDDGVEAAHLVEVHLLGRPAVEVPLGLGQRAEDRQRPAADPLGQPGLLHERGDVGGRAHDGGVLDLDVDLGGRDAAAQHRFGLEPPAAHRQPLDHRAHLVDVGPGVEQRPQGHVPGDPREAVEPGDPRHRPTRRPRDLALLESTGTARTTPDRVVALT